MGSHSFGLRKERRKFPHFLSHTCNDSKRGEKSKEKGENGEKMKEKKERG